MQRERLSQGLSQTTLTVAQDLAKRIEDSSYKPDEVVKSVQKLGPEGIRVLGNLVLDSTSSVTQRERAIGLLGKVDKEQGIPELLTLLKSGKLSSKACDQCIEAIGSNNFEEYDSTREHALAGLLRQPGVSSEVRSKALLKLRELIEPSPTTRQSLEALARDSSQTLSLRTSAGELLSRSALMGIGEKPEVLPLAQQLLKEAQASTEPGPLARALNAVAYSGGTREAELLLKVLKTSPPERLAAMSEPLAEGLAIMIQQRMLKGEAVYQALERALKVPDLSKTARAGFESMQALADPDQTLRNKISLLSNANVNTEKKAAALDILSSIKELKPELFKDPKNIQELQKLIPTLIQSPDTAHPLTKLAIDLKSAPLIEAIHGAVVKETKLPPENRASIIKALAETSQELPETMRHKMASDCFDLAAAERNKPGYIDSDMYRNMLAAIGDLGDRSLAGKLYEWRACSNGGTDGHVVTALCHLSYKPIADLAVRSVIQHHADVDWKEATPFLAMMGDRRVVEFLRDKVSDPNEYWYTRSQAIEALSAFNGREIDATLRSVLTDPSQGVRRAARIALVQHHDLQVGQNWMNDICTDPAYPDRKGELAQLAELRSASSFNAMMRVLSDQTLEKNGEGPRSEVAKLLNAEPHKVQAALEQAAQQCSDHEFAQKLGDYALNIRSALELGIKHPFRFSPDFLREVVQNRRQGPALAPGQQRVAVVAIAEEDHNGALSQLVNLESLRQQGYRVMLYEVGADSEKARRQGYQGYTVEQALRESTTVGKNMRPAELLVLAGHGSRDSISLGAGDKNATMLDGGYGAIATSDRGLFHKTGMDRRLSADAQVITISCMVGTGRDAKTDRPNVINYLRRELPHIPPGEIWGAEATTNFDGFEYNDRGRIQKVLYTVPSYQASVQPEQDPQKSKFVLS